MEGVWVRFGEMGEFLEWGVWGFDFSWVIWGGEVYDEGEGLGMRSLRNGGVVGFGGDVAIGKYSGLVSRCTKSFRENKPPILIGILI